MTSQVSREQVVDQLYFAGVKDPKKVAKVMLAVEAYVIARIRNAMPVPEESETERVKLYKCTGKGMCHKEKPLKDFPQKKQDNPRLQSPCTYCDQRVVTSRDVHPNRQ